MSSLLLIKSMLFANSLKKAHKKKKRRVLKSQSVKKVSSNLCRICTDERGNIPMFNNIVYPNIPEDIKTFTGVVISKMESFSNYMCQSCLDLLKCCITFKELCQRSNDKIMEYSVKKEFSSYKKDEAFNSDSEDSFTVPTPTISEDNSEIWGCSTCNKDFDNMVSYNKHLSKCSSQTQSKVEEKPSGEVKKKKFLCDTCGKTAFSNAGLLVHMSTHEDVFPFKCEQCPYKGRTMDLLKVHKRSHLADKPYKCTQCPKATTTSSNLNKHMRHVHSNSRPYKCTYCEKGFSYQHDMRRHIKDIHLRQGTVECDVCFKKFNTKKILQGHRLKIHKIKSERHGRLPSYLQCQMKSNNENNMNGGEQIC